MSVSLRLTRMGKKKRPFYRVVAVDSRKARDGKYIEKLGHYDPFKEEGKVLFYKEIVFKWFGYGAQPTAAVRRLLSSQGLLLEWETLKRESRSEESSDKEVGKKKKVRRSRCRPMAEKIKLREEQKKILAGKETYLKKKEAAKKAEEAKKAAEAAASETPEDAKSEEAAATPAVADSVEKTDAKPAPDVEAKPEAQAAMEKNDASPSDPPKSDTTTEETK